MEKSGNLITVDESDLLMVQLAQTALQGLLAGDHHGSWRCNTPEGYAATACDFAEALMVEFSQRWIRGEDEETEDEETEDEETEDEETEDEETEDEETEDEEIEDEEIEDEEIEE